AASATGYRKGINERLVLGFRAAWACVAAQSRAGPAQDTSVGRKRGEFVGSVLACSVFAAGRDRGGNWNPRTDSHLQKSRARRMELGPGSTEYRIPGVVGRARFALPAMDGFAANPPPARGRPVVPDCVLHLHHRDSRR